jgi:thiamine-phosphate pyrophosphorylase
MSADLRLYALVDPERAGGRDLPALARELAAGGATLMQLRDKQGATRAMVESARAIRSALAPFNIPFLVNDRADVAFAAGADGVHLGQDDMTVEDARRLLGPHAVIGLSIKTLAQAAEAPIELLDYVCIGGVFATTSKDNPDPPIGLGGLQAIFAKMRARDADLPIGAIAGIDAKNAADVIAAGVDGIAVISALSLARDPELAARDLRGIVEAALAKRQTALSRTA